MCSLQLHESGDHAVETQLTICKLNPIAFAYSPFYPRGDLAVAFMLPASPKGAPIMRLGFVWGMVNTRHPETWQETTEHVTFRWRLLLPESSVAAEKIQTRPLGVPERNPYSENK